MKLAKALKVKNRTIGEINRLKAILQRENSRKTTDRVTIDIEVLKDELEKNITLLIKIKTAITHANIGIYSAICEMDELKSVKDFYSNLNTTEGEVRERFHTDETASYVAHIKRDDVDRMTKEMQVQIDALQDRIDEYNSSVDVEM